MASLCQCHGRSLAKLMRRAAGASEIDGTVGAGSGMDSVVPGVKRSHTTAGPKGIDYNGRDMEGTNSLAHCCCAPCACQMEIDCTTNSS